MVSAYMREKQELNRIERDLYQDFKKEFDIKSMAQDLHKNKHGNMVLENKFFSVKGKQYRTYVIVSRLEILEAVSNDMAIIPEADPYDGFYMYRFNITGRVHTIKTPEKDFYPRKN